MLKFQNVRACGGLTALQVKNVWFESATYVILPYKTSAQAKILRVESAINGILPYKISVVEEKVSGPPPAIIFPPSLEMF